MFQLRKLPYRTDVFGDFISEEAFSYHYGKHHQSYINNLNQLIKGTEFEHVSLADIIFQAHKTNMGIFNNAAQVYNHDFYWDCISPSKTAVSEALSAAIKAEFGSMDMLKDKFLSSSATLFGSGWNWLLYNLTTKKLEIIQTSNAATPINDNKVPLLVVDVWEHAYYIDHRNARPMYLEAFWKHICWDFVSRAYEWALKEGIHSARFYINELHPVE